MNEKKSGGGGAMKVIGIGCLVLMLLFCVGGAFVVQRGKAMVIEAGRDMASRAVQDTKLSDAQKQGVIKQVDRVFDGVKAGTISGDQAAKIIKAVMEGPLLSLGIVFSAEQRYVEKGSLEEKLKVEARLNFNRFCRGMIDSSIDQASARRILSMVQVPNPKRPKQKRMKASLSPAELSAFLTAIKGAADEAKVSPEMKEVDIATEVGRTIDKALKGKN